MATTRTLTKANADALAAAWMRGEVAPEDYDPRIREWRLDESIREAIAFGDLDQRQFVEELHRREEVGRFHHETVQHQEKHPWQENGLFTPNPTYKQESDDDFDLWLPTSTTDSS